MSRCQLRGMAKPCSSGSTFGRARAAARRCNRVMLRSTLARELSSGHRRGRGAVSAQQIKSMNDVSWCWAACIAAAWQRCKLAGLHMQPSALAAHVAQCSELQRNVAPLGSRIGADFPSR